MASNHEHFLYVGPHRGTENIAQIAPQYMGQLRDATRFVGGEPPTAEEQGLIREVHAGMVAVADEVGVDIRDRLTRHYHLFGDVPTYERAVHDYWGPDGFTGGGGKNHPQVGVMWVRREERSHNASGIGHETWHDVGLRLVRPTLTSSVVDEEGVRHNSVSLHATSGYTRITPKNKGHGVEEWVVDMATARTNRLAGLGPTMLGYISLDLVGDALIRKAARESGMLPDELEKLLIRGRLVNDLTGIRIIGRTLGPERMSRLLRTTGGEDPEEAKQLAVDLGLPGAVEALEARAKTGEVDIFSWNRATVGAKAPSPAPGATPSGQASAEAAAPSGSGDGLISQVAAKVMAAVQQAQGSQLAVSDALAAIERGIASLRAVADGSEELVQLVQQLQTIHEGLTRVDASTEEGCTEIGRYLGEIGIHS